MGEDGAGGDMRGRDTLFIRVFGGSVTKIGAFFCFWVPNARILSIKTFFGTFDYREAKEFFKVGGVAFRPLNGKRGGRGR